MGERVSHPVITAPPCESCPYAGECATGLACDAFLRYVTHPNERNWRNEPRRPTPDLFRKVATGRRRRELRAR